MCTVWCGGVGCVVACLLLCDGLSSLCWLCLLCQGTVGAGSPEPPFTRAEQTWRNHSATFNGSWLLLPFVRACLEF